jgi:hypothetical protein
MRHLKLDLTALNIDSFDITPLDQNDGTVIANQGETDIQPSICLTCAQCSLVRCTQPPGCGPGEQRPAKPEVPEPKRPDGAPTPGP